MLEEFLKRSNIKDRPEEIQDLQTEICHFNKGTIITQSGQVENYIYLLKEGGVKVSYYDELKEYILDFWFQGDFFSSYVSFIQQSPSLTQIQTLSPTIVERISHSQINSLYQKSHLGSEIGRKMAESLYVHKTMKEISLITYTAEQRYKILLEKSKNLIQEVSVKEIASYLGIQPESLSRIRRKVTS